MLRFIFNVNTIDNNNEQETTGILCNYEVSAWPAQLPVPLSLSLCDVRLHDVRVWIWRQNLCVAAARLSPATTQGWQPTLLCKMCIPVLTFKKTFGPITFEQIIELWPNCYHSLPPSTTCLLQNADFQNSRLSAQRPRMCAWVRLSFPYYRVRISKGYIRKSLGK